MGNKDSYKTYKSLAAKIRYYSPVLIRGEEDQGVKLWGYGTTIYENLLEKYVDPDWGDLSDPKTGRDLTVWTVPKGAAGNDTEYDKPKMDVSPKESLLLPKKSDIVKLLEEMPNYLNDGVTFPVKSYQELMEVVRKLSDVDEDESDSTSYSASTIEESDEDSDDDGDDNDLKNKLKKLLGD